VKSVQPRPGVVADAYDREYTADVRYNSGEIFPLFMQRLEDGTDKIMMMNRFVNDCLLL
jgi:hypothetical protein